MMPPDFIFTFHPVGIFFVVLLTVGAISAGLHVLFGIAPFRRYSERAADLSSTVMTLCGTMFFLSVTFLANSVWNMEDRARESVYAEARNVRVIRTYVDAMTGPSQDSFARLIEAYGAAVAAEWPNMRDPEGRRAAEQALSDIYRAVIAGLSEGDQNRLLQQRLVVALDALSAARQQRLSMAQDVISVGQWFLVMALGFLLLFVVAMGHGRFPAARNAALTAMALAISIALFVIIAHDRPFLADLSVSAQPILRATGRSE
jgi:hypothetical protein